MFAEVHFPETLQGPELDRYLNSGWFRMGQSIFTTNFLNFKNELYSAIWLRVVLSEFYEDKTQKEIARRNASFRTEIVSAIVTPEKEELYLNYRTGLSFEPSSTLSELLFRNSTRNIYNTWEVNIYDAGKLIASGFFDVGKNAAAGITSFYDPAYKKGSLGKHLIYLKMNYCKGIGLRYFYPGYFVPGYPFFDYKLKMGATALEYLQLRSGTWLPVSRFSEKNIALQQMNDKLLELQRFLLGSAVNSVIFRYGYFDANLVPELQGAELFDFPLFLTFDTEPDALSPLVVYDIRDEQFHVLKCRSLWMNDLADANPKFYARHLLKTEAELGAAESVDTIASLFLSCLTKDGK